MLSHIKFFVLSLVICSLGCSSQSPVNLPNSPSQLVGQSPQRSSVSYENSLDPRLADYVPNWEQMTLVHSAQEIYLLDILDSGELRTRQLLYPKLFNNPDHDHKPDWTQEIFTQVVNKNTLNGHFHRSMTTAGHQPRVLIELDLNLLVNRDDYTVAHYYDHYWGQRFPYFQNPVLAKDEVAEGTHPERVKAKFEMDFSSHPDDYWNEVVFRKAVISLTTMDIRLHFQSEEQKSRFESNPDFLEKVRRYWHVKSAGNSLILKKIRGY